MIQIIIFLIIIILIFYILYKVFKSVLKIIIASSIIIIIFIAFLGVLVYKDINNIKDNMDKPLMILLEDEKFIAGLKLQQDKATYLTENEINTFNEKEIDQILGSNFKILIIDINFIEEAPLQTIENKEFNVKITKEDVINILKSETPIDYLLTKVLNLPQEAIFLTKKDILSDEISDEVQFKALVTISFLKELIDNKETEYIINSYKKGKIRIYKETIVFKLLKLIPNKIVLNAIDNIQM